MHYRLAPFVVASLLTTIGTVFAVDKSKFRDCAQSPHCRPKEVRACDVGGVTGAEDGSINVRSSSSADDYFKVTAYTDQTVNIRSSKGTVSKSFDKESAQVLPWMPVFPSQPSSVSMMSVDGLMGLRVDADGVSVFGVDGVMVSVDLSKFEFTFDTDVAFYGLPLHTTPLRLPNTIPANNTAPSEPIRFYNSDVFEYELDSTMALYGAIPMVIARQPGTGDSVGIFYNDPSDLFVDLDDSLCRFMAESMETTGNAVDVWIYLGRTVKDVVKQHCVITGLPMLPPLFSLGYHQCRWNYKDQKDVLAVDDGFDSHGIPYDVIWLDIEHTDDKRYFTFDTQKFPNITALTNHLNGKGRRKMVVIVDPHIKVDPQWTIYKELVDNQYYVQQSKTGRPFEGDCWPGKSVWVDFFKDKARQWWAELYGRHYPQDNIYIWNDMNEPAVFNIPELSFPRDATHNDGTISHHSVHNLYGHLMHMATRDGLLLRSPKQRPFVLSRSFYAGTQTIGPIWTGDNAADWSHLRASIPMLLSLGLTGMPFVGADVGGFFGNPDAELLTRWYQLGALQPFFRGHAHIETKRREPWLFGEPWTTAIKKAIRLRYRLLPYIYTTMFMAHRHGLPVNRPTFMEFPGADDDDDGKFMLGESILCAPILDRNVTSVTVELPHGAVWYDYHSLQKVESVFKSSVNLFATPMFLRGGHIITTKDMPRRSTAAMSADPLSIIVALDNNMTASGLSYVDSGDGFDYLKGNRCLSDLKFANMTLSNKPHPGQLKTFTDSNVSVRDITIVGLAVNDPIYVNEKSVKSFSVDPKSGAVKIIPQPGAIRLDTEWSFAVHIVQSKI